MQFSENLKHLRIKNKVTQEQLAEYLLVSRSTIAGYETKSKQPDYEKLIQIASFFNVSIDYLITGQEREPNAISPLDCKKSVNDPKKLALLNIINSIDTQHLDHLCSYAEFLAYKTKQKK